MVSDLINRAAVAFDNKFSRSNEYIFIVYIGGATPAKIALEEDWNHIENTTKNGVHWVNLCRTGTNARREDRPNMFYPIFVSEKKKRIKGLGDILPLGESRDTIIPPDGCIAVWPIRSDGSEGRWMQSKDSLEKLIEKGYVKLGRLTKTGMAISYLNRAQIEKIEQGQYTIKGYEDSGTVVLDDSNYSAVYVPDTQWDIKSHDAARHGTNLLNKILASKRFTFPKSLYAVHDVLRFFVINKPNALILDFFAGSGTTLHAVNLLNQADNGKRRCILVTNNEVSDEEAKMLKEKGYGPGDVEWEAFGIANHVTWPRTVCSIKGCDVNGDALQGKYLNNDMPMSDGFSANANFFKLGFLDKTKVSLGLQFKELLSTLWMKAGAFGKCPSIEGDVPEMLILPSNRMAILNDENYFSEFAAQIAKNDEIDVVYLVTDYESSFVSMSQSIQNKVTYQLYRDYLDNFRINAGRNAR